MITSHDREKKTQNVHTVSRWVLLDYPLSLKLCRFALFVIGWHRNVFPNPAQVLNKFKQVYTTSQCDEMISAYLGTCRLAPPPSPWIEVVREKKAVWRSSRREEDCAWRGERQNKRRWLKTRLAQTSRLGLDSSPNGSRSLWIELKRRWVRETSHTGSVYLQKCTNVCQTPGPGTPGMRHVHAGGCRFLPRYSWSKMWNNRRAVGHDTHCCAFPALPQSNSL